MPINKNALLRYQILDRCFSNRHHKYEIEELVDKVNEAFLDIYGSESTKEKWTIHGTYISNNVKGGFQYEEQNEKNPLLDIDCNMHD